MPKAACKNQCKQCPFRSTSAPGWLGNYQGPGEVLTSLWHDSPFFCHARADYEREDWLEVLMEGGELCLGALIVRGRLWIGIPESEDPEVREAVSEAVKRYRSDPDSFDVMGPRAFMDHHEEMWERVAARRRDGNEV